MSDLLIHVLLPTGGSVSYEVPSDSTVQNLVDKINSDESVKVPKKRKVVIIYRGRILSPDDVLSSFDSLVEFSVHAFFRIDSSIQESESSSEELNEPRGFDRLVRMDFTPEQIAEIRRNFHIMHHSEHESSSTQIDLEEEWFPVIFNLNDYEEILRQVSGVQSNNTETHTNARAQQNQQQQNPLVNQVNDLEMDIDTDLNPNLDEKPWIICAFGFIFGLVFGGGGLASLIMFYGSKTYVVGLFCGIIINFLISIYII